MDAVPAVVPVTEADLDPVPSRPVPVTAASALGGDLLFRSNPLPMWVYDAETLRFLDVNDAAVERYGYARERFLSMTIASIRPDEDVPALFRALDVAVDPLRHAGTWRHLRADGSVIDVEIDAQRIVFDGRPAMLVVARDVTDEVRSKQELARLAAIVESSSDVIIGKTLDGTIFAWNAAAERTYGYPKDEALGRHITMIIPEDRVEEWRKVVDTVGAGRFLAPFETVRLAKDGSAIDVAVAASPVRDVRGNIVGVSVIARDIRERKRTEEGLRRALEKERQAAEHLRAADAMKNAFLNAVSHELRTPLTSVLGGALTLQRLGLDLSDGDQRDILGAVVTNAKKLQRMLSDLLDLDRLTRGVLKPNLEQTELGSLIRNIVEHADGLDGRRVDLEVHAMVLPVDPPKVERIVENLLANAVKHTPPGTPIWVSIRRVPEGAELAVEDVGSGIAEEERGRIFEPFHRVGDEHQHAPGVGIGLSLVARFAELHGGRAWVEPRAGGGSSFKVLLREPTAPRSDEM